MPEHDEHLELIAEVTNRTLPLVSVLARNAGLDVDELVAGGDDGARG
ncbi:hypothetical protein SMC26_18005 [Actinomadura fulvescens]|uniref:Uncharacterized protein n=1 Tax=Actinomadura fulvescens TaxID=46160 RepID=A0ABP6CC14_9ACTN